MAMIPPYSPWEEEQYQPERPDDLMHYRNYPARPAVEVLEELVAKFRYLKWIPMRYGWPQIVERYYDEDDAHPNAVSICFYWNSLVKSLSYIKVHKC